MTFISTLFSSSTHTCCITLCHCTVWKEMIRDNRVEETLKCSSSGTTQTDLLLVLRPIWNQHFCKKTQLWISNPCFHICNLCLEISAVIQCFLNTFDLNHTFRDVFFHAL